MGSVGAALNRDALKRMNITHVLIVAKSLDPAFPNDFIYKKIEGNKVGPLQITDLCNLS